MYSRRDQSPVAASPSGPGAGGFGLQRARNHAVHKSGHLYISSKARGWKSWKRRWFVLTRTSLVFFKAEPRTPGGGDALGGIALNNSGAVDVRPDKRWLTVIFPDGRAFTLKAETPEDLESWRQALEKALGAAPSAELMVSENIFRDDSGNLEFSGEAQVGRDSRPRGQSLVVGRPILLALEDIDGSPSFLEKALQYIEQHALDTEGLLRVSADVAEVEQRVQDYESGRDFLQDGPEDPHVIADCIKVVLRELPSSPVTTPCCIALLEAFRIESREARMAALQQTVYENFPEPNRRLVARVLRMMRAVVQHSELNRMKGPAVAACMAPLLLRPLMSGECGLEDDSGDYFSGDGSAAVIAAATAANLASSIVLHLMEDYESIFIGEERARANRQQRYADPGGGGSAKEVLRWSDNDDDSQSTMRGHGNDADSDEPASDCLTSGGMASGELLEERGPEGEGPVPSTTLRAMLGQRTGPALPDMPPEKRRSRLSAMKQFLAENGVIPPTQDEPGGTPRGGGGGGGATAADEAANARLEAGGAGRGGQDVAGTRIVDDPGAVRGSFAHLGGEIVASDHGSMGQQGHKMLNSPGARSRAGVPLGGGSNGQALSPQGPGGGNGPPPAVLLDLTGGVEEEMAVHRLELKRDDLRNKLLKEGRMNAALQAGLERRKQALRDRRNALEQDVAVLNERLTQEMNVRAALEGNLEAVASANLPDRVVADIREIATIDASISSLKDNVSELHGRRQQELMQASQLSRMDELRRGGGGGGQGSDYRNQQHLQSLALTKAQLQLAVDRANSELEDERLARGGGTAAGGAQQEDELNVLVNQMQGLLARAEDLLNQRTSAAKSARTRQGPEDGRPRPSASTSPSLPPTEGPQSVRQRQRPPKLVGPFPLASTSPPISPAMTGASAPAPSVPLPALALPPPATDRPSYLPAPASPGMSTPGGSAVSSRRMLAPPAAPYASTMSSLSFDSSHQRHLSLPDNNGGRTLASLVGGEANLTPGGHGSSPVSARVPGSPIRRSADGRYARSSSPSAHTPHSQRGEGMGAGAGDLASPALNELNVKLEQFKERRSQLMRQLSALSEPATPQVFAAGEEGGGVGATGGVGGGGPGSAPSFAAVVPVDASF